MKKLSRDDYTKYMSMVNANIKETERRIDNLEINQKVSKLSFEEWVKFQNGELKIK